MVSNRWGSMYGHVKWVGKRVITCQMGGRACRDVLNAWESAWGRAKSVGKRVLMC
jgi:hypothetical protein